MAPSAIVALCLLALASAAPHTSDIQCSTSCNPSSKFSYAPGVTYAYQYTGRQGISIDGVEEGSSNSEWSANIALTWITPCDVEISVQNVAGSNIPEIQESQIAKYPLVLAVNNGIVESTCSHPEDDESSINVKKAIASALQNSLPSMEPTSEIQVIKEDDVVGTCPTEYTITAEEGKTVVTKEKNHIECQEHFYDQAKMSVLPSATPLPMHDSKSNCRQEITNGIYSTIACKETKVITPGFGVFKYVKAVQEFTIQFISESADTSVISNHQGVALRSHSLKHEHSMPIKNTAVIARIDAIMPEICTLSQGQSNIEVASLVAQVIEFLRFVPDDAVVEVIDKIRAGQYCADYTKLESLFLDAVAFVGEPGAFKVMAQEIAAGRTTSGRFSLYTVAINLLTMPTLNHVAALTPIFGMTESNQLLSLAASTVVNRYCYKNVGCDETAQVKEILNVLSAKLNTQCTSDFSNVKTTQVLTTLKSVGNIGKTTTALFESVMKCALTEGIETNVRFAATMSLKGATCMEPVTQGLKSVVLDTNMNTEVRIGSYLAAVHCANAGDLQEVIDQMSTETNKQVQGFILSHLANLKESNWSLKQTLHEILTTKNIPSDYLSNIFKYSRNIEMSYNTPIVEVGGLVESNIVYTPESYVPRLVNLGLNMNLLGSFLNIGEVGARVEGLDQYFEDALGPNSYLYKEVFGPESYLYKTPLWTIAEDSKLFVTNTGTELVHLVKNAIKEKNIDIDSIVTEIKKLMKISKNVNVESLKKTIMEMMKEYKNIDVQALLKSVDIDAIINVVVNFLKTKNIEIPRTDLYAILRGQERAFLSIGGKQNKFNVIDLVETVTPVIMDAILGAKDLNMDTTRTGQINFDYSIPTISGFPLKVKLTGTLVAGLKMSNNLNVKKSAIDALLKIIPSFNVDIEAQIGFGELLNTGLKLKNTAYTTNGFSLSVAEKNGEDLELQLELPEKMEFFDIHSEVFLMKLDKASNEVKLFPSKMQDVRIISNQCSSFIEPVTGLMVCYNINVPNLVKSDSLPLGQPMVARMFVQKSDVAMMGYRLAAKLRNKPEKKLLKIVAGTYGSANSKESALKLTYTSEQDTHLMVLNIQSSFVKSTTEMTFINQPEYMSIQVYCNDKFAHFSPVEGSVKVEFKPVTVSNGKTYEVATYAGLRKSLNEKHRLFKMMLSILEDGDMKTANFNIKTDLFPAMIEVAVALPKSAGLKLYKVEKITVCSTVSSVVVESRFLKKSPEVFQTTLLVLNSGSTLINIDAVNTISIASPILGGSVNKMHLMTSVNGKTPIAEFGFGSKLHYENGVLELAIGDSEVLAFNSKLTYDNRALETLNNIMFHNSEVLAFNSKLTYGNRALETLSNIVFHKSEVLLLNSKTSYANGKVEFISGAKYFDSTIFSAKLQQTLDITNLAFMTEIDVPVVEFGIASEWSYSNLMFNSRNAVLYSGSEVVASKTNLGYANGAITFSKLINNNQLYVEVQPFDVKAKVTIPSVLYLDLQQTIDSTALTTVAQIDMPDMIKPLKIHHVFRINSAFSYSVLTDVNSGGKVLLHIEGPLSFAFSKTLIQQNLDLKISGAFEGTFKIMHGITMTLQKMQYLVDVRHSSTPIVFVDLVLDGSNGNEIALKSTVNVPFVTESEMAATVTTSLIHSTMNTVALPNTPYARRFKGYADFNWVENNFKGDLYWDAEKNTDMKIGFTTKYALDTTAFKFIIQGDLIVSTFNYGYKFESLLASPFEWFQGVNGMDFTVTLPSKKIAVAKSILDIQYTDSKVSLKPLIAFITINDNKYELTTSVVLKKLPAFLNFVVTSETKMSTPQLKQITFVTSIMHEDKEQTEKIAFNMKLEESVLSEVISFEYLMQFAPSEYSRIVKFIKGSNVATLSTVIHLESGVKVFEITNELSLPFIGLNSLVTKMTKTAEGTTSLTLVKNQAMIVRVYYSIPSITSHIVGVKFPSRTLEFSAAFARNQVTFKVFPEKNKSAKVVETTLRLIQKSGTGQFEVLVTAPSLSKEMRFAVELELIEPGKEGFDMVSIDVQYQVSEAHKLLKATLKELKNVYVDLVNDGMCPDLNKWYREVQKIFKQIPKFLNSIKDELTMSIPKFCEFVKTYLMNLYQLHEADIIALWNTARTELLRYYNIVRTEGPVIFNNYINILKKTETWNVVQTMLSELLANYPAYYDATVDFYNKVILTYVAELTDMVGQVLVVPEFDVSQYVTILKKEFSDIVKNVASQILDTKIVKIIQEKVTELKVLYPAEFSLLENIYTTVILPTSSEVLEVVNKILAIPAIDSQKYWTVIISEVPAVFNKLSQRILDTQLVTKLRASYPTLFIIIDDIYSNVFLPTLNDIVEIVKKVTKLPVDFQEYWAITKVEVPVFVNHFMQRILDTQIVMEMKASFPIVFEISEDFYGKAILPTLQDIIILTEKIIVFPVVDFQETFKQYWAFIKAEVPPMFNKLVQRLPDTKLVQMLKTLYPMVFDVSDDFYTQIIVPTATDLATVVEKLITIPMSDIQVVVQQYWNMLEVELPTLTAKFLERLPEAKLVKLTMEISTELLQLLQEKLTVLKSQYPIAYATAMDFYNKVAVPACSELSDIYGKLTKTSDIYQIRDLLKTEIMMLINNLLKNMSTTDLMNMTVTKFNELVALYPEEHKAVLRFYNQFSQITMSNIFATVKSYINEELGITYSITAERFTAVVSLPVSVATVRNYYHIITVYAPAYVADIVEEWLAQGRVLYKYIEARIPVVIDYINIQAPIYFQYIKNYLEKLQVIIPQYVKKIQANLPKFVEEVQTFLLPYVEEIIKTTETYVEFARDSVYGKLVEKKVSEAVKLFLSKIEEVMKLYPAEIQAFKDFLSLYMNICIEYATWTINTIVEYPTVKKVIEYMLTLTPEKVQATLDIVMKYVMSTVNQMEKTVNGLITAIPKDIPAFIKLHIPEFIISFITSIVAYLN